MQVRCQGKKLLEWRLPGLLKAFYFIEFNGKAEVLDGYRLRKVAVRFSDTGAKREQSQIVFHQKSRQRRRRW
jgi:hypothetical protein